MRWSLDKYKDRPFVLQSVDDYTNEKYAKLGFHSTGTKAAVWSKLKAARWPRTETDRQDLKEMLG